MSKVKVTYPFAIMMAVFIFFDSENKLLLTVFSMLIHEMGHISALLYKNIPIQKIIIGMTGANIVYGNDRLTSYADDIFIAVMGSVFNFITVVISLFVENIFSLDMSFFIGINAVLGAFNMAPIIPLDGGRAMLGIISLKAGLSEAEEILRRMSIAEAVIGIIIGIILIYNSKNYTLLLVSVVILLYNKLEI